MFYLLLSLLFYLFQILFKNVKNLLLKSINNVKLFINSNQKVYSNSWSLLFVSNAKLWDSHFLSIFYVSFLRGIQINIVFRIVTLRLWPWRLLKCFWSSGNCTFGFGFAFLWLIMTMNLACKLWVIFVFM